MFFQLCMNEVERNGMSWDPDNATDNLLDARRTSACRRYISSSLSGLVLSIDL
jgi:hypothetical protein